MRLLPAILLAALAAPLAADGLDPSTLPQNDPPQLLHSLYLRMNLGYQSYSSGMDERLPAAVLPIDSVDGYTESDGAVAAEFALGYQDPSGLGLELGFSASPVSTLYIMPVYRLASSGLGSRPLLHTFGARLGWSSIGLQGSAYDSYYGSFDSNGDDSYDSLDQPPPSFRSYALTYRLEQMLGGRFSLGLDLSYRFVRTDVAMTHHWTTVTQLPYPYYDVYTDHSSPVTRTFDYSGPSVELTLGLWPARPFWGQADIDAQKAVDERRRLRDERRMARLTGRYPAPAAAEAHDFANAADAILVGRAALDSEQPSVAKDAFQQAVLLDPQSAPAWRGLADAEYALALPAKALPHYQRALALKPDDPALGDFIAKLKAKLDEVQDSQP